MKTSILQEMYVYQEELIARIKATEAYLEERKKKKKKC